MVNCKKIIITLDGPASTGKSSLAKRLSNTLGYMHIDSGSMYRAATLFALRLDPERILRPNVFLKYLSEINIDFKKINLFTGSYSFWYESSQLALRQRSSANKKAEDKRKELQEFISRFSANASKSKQATSRKKLLEKINLDDIQASNRKYPAIIFEQERDAGDQILELKSLSYENDGETYFKDISFNLNKGEKVLILSKNMIVCNY